jgi:hypothetical protein
MEINALSLASKQQVTTMRVGRAMLFNNAVIDVLGFRPGLLAVKLPVTFYAGLTWTESS